MCGRFTLFDSADSVAERFGLPDTPSLSPRYNIAPSQTVAAVRIPPGGGARELVALRWGLIPSWAKDPSIGSRMINARSETVAEKPAFRAAIRRRRCLVPADGFYEWKRADGRKQPYYILMRDRKTFAFGGIFSLYGIEAQRPSPSKHQPWKGQRRRSPSTSPPWPKWAPRWGQKAPTACAAPDSVRYRTMSCPK